MRIKYYKERLFALAFVGIILVPIFVFTLFFKSLEESPWGVWTSQPFIWLAVVLSSLVMSYVYSYRAFIQPVTYWKLLRYTVISYALITLAAVFIFELRLFPPP